MSKDLTNLLSDLQLTENNAVFYFKEDNWKSIVSKETQNKLQIIKPTAFYIFNKQPYILFFDLTENTDTNRKKEIHKQAWSFDQAPVIFIIQNNSIEVFNAFQLEKNELLAQIDKKEAIKNCNFWNLQSGDMFEWFQNKYKATLKKKRVNQRLFENIKQTIKILVELNLPEKEAKLLVLRLIFIRYLIDRKIRIDNTFIEGHENEVLTRRKSLSNLIKEPKRLVKFFEYLDTRFNGVLFKELNIELLSEQASKLADLFNTDNTTHLFINDIEFCYNVFDFGIIPVELISGIYESILDPTTKEATSAVYTPPFLVDYILTQTVDKYFEKNTSSLECPVFDPAMGSGIFIVQSFRRMADKVNKDDFNTTQYGELIKQIAENNLFGIDINNEAIDVACFSVYVALLDYQAPADIDVYLFPTLKGKNFHHVNFFDLQKENILNEIKNKDIKFILGNPPWKNNTDTEHIDWLVKSKNRNIVSDNQIAQSYLIRVNDFANKNTQIALIVTSKAIYNNYAIKFKELFLRNYKLNQCLDLSPVRHLVFENASNPAMILFFEKANIENKPSNENIVTHISIKQNKFFNKNFKNLVIEKFDYKEISQKHFIENSWMFKLALYGNTLDYLLLKKICSIERKIVDFINIKENQLVFGDGIKKHTVNSIKKLKTQPKKFIEITSLPVIETSDINPYFTFPSQDNYPKEKDFFVKSGNKIELYLGNKILLTANPVNGEVLNISFSEGSSVFREKTLGIISKNENQLFKLLSIFWSDLFTYYQFLVSSQWGTFYPQILQTEYLSFPYKEPTESQKNLLVSLVDKLLQPYKDYYNTNPEFVYNGEPNKNVLDKINEIIYEIYEIKPHERDLIDYVLNVSRYQFQDKKESQDKVSEFSTIDGSKREKSYVIDKYIEVFKEQLQAVYGDEAIEVDIYELNHFTALNFKFDDTKTSSWKIKRDTKDNDEKSVLKMLSKKLSISQITTDATNEHNLFIQKDIKGFEENSFYIIKPNEYKCWHRAMAWYDVAEIREAILGAEIGRIKGRSFSE
jgi:hypothetical protein